MFDSIFENLQNYEYYTLSFCIFSLCIKVVGHLFLPDGGGFSMAGFDPKKGNADVIVLLLFLYGRYMR